MPQKFYLTTPIYYVNARPHIGHAYTTIAADVLARRHRLLGDDVFFLTGTDEHGQKIERSAAAAGIPPQQFADEVAASFEALWKRMGITNDKFIRTTSPEHKRGVQKLWRELEKRGAIYLSSYTGAYCVSDETFVDLPAGTPCPDCGRPLEIVTEENYFFRLSAYQKELIERIKSNDPHYKLNIQPDARRNEVLSFLEGKTFEPIYDNGSITGNLNWNARTSLEAMEIAHSKGLLGKTSLGTFYQPGALKDLSISRTSFKWGIPVPDDEKHVIYVWLDALTNYMTAVGYGADSDASLTAQQREEAAAKFAKYWPADLHLVGKEIIRFHCVYWPAFLLAAGLPLPKKIQAHGWLLFEESKMSKSRGNIVRTETILDAFGDHYKKELARLGQPEPDKRDCDLFAADVLRYFLLREIPFGQDGSFSFDALITRYNADLANGYGNLVSRVLTLTNTAFSGSIPTYPSEPSGIPLKALFSSYADGDITQLLRQIWLFIAEVDSRITADAPWKLAKSDSIEDREKLEQSLWRAYEAIRVVTAFLYPIVPHSSRKVWAALGLGDIEEASRSGELERLDWGGLKPGTKLGPLAPIFPRAPKELAQVMSDIESQSNPPKPAEPVATASPSAPASASPAASAADAATPRTSNPEPGTSLISIDDFAKVDLRVARVLVAERIPKADKLLRLEVDLGYEKRQILAGIAQYYEPEKLIGRKVVIVANLAPRKMRGLESQGMVVAASIEPDGAPTLAGFLEDVEIGARLK